MSFQRPSIKASLRQGLLSLANKIPAARADPAAPVGFFNASASWERLAEKRHPPNPAGSTGTGISALQLNPGAVGPFQSSSLFQGSL